MFILFLFDKGMQAEIINAETNVLFFKDRKTLKCIYIEIFVCQVWTLMLSILYIQLGAQSSLMKMTAVNSAFDWQSYNEEPASSNEDDSLTAYALWEQINVTRDSTDYLWYMTE